MLASASPAQEPWFWESALAIASLLLFANLLLLAIVFGRRLRNRFRGWRAAEFRRRFERVLEEIGPGLQIGPLREHVRSFDELERPLAAAMLVERLGAFSPEQRSEVLELLRESGSVELLLRSTRRWAPWRRALAIRTLGWVGAEEAVPVLVERLGDRNRHVRDAAVRALGRIGSTEALPPLAALYADPGRRVSPGFVYEALVAVGGAEPAFVEGLRSQDERVRVVSCFGVARVLPADEARSALEPMLDDPAAPVRAAACLSLGRVGSGQAPTALARAVHDAEPSVRREAAAALGVFDDPGTVGVLLEALEDPDREVALRAGESLVRLSRLPSARAGAEASIAGSESWPLQTAAALASVGAV